MITSIMPSLILIPEEQERIMKAVIQRAASASVEIEGAGVRSIGKGLMVLLGVGRQDRENDAVWIAKKIASMRLFDDDGGKVNLSVGDIGGDVLVVSQFTLYASTRKGNRPSFDPAAPPDIAVPLYRLFLSELEKQLMRRIVTGEFGARMRVSLVNDGPVTILLDSQTRD
jgi:D-tyrosyl-tRNA(Tyr) deacylase